MITRAEKGACGRDEADRPQQHCPEANSRLGDPDKHERQEKLGRRIASDTQKKTAHKEEGTNTDSSKDGANVRAIQRDASRRILDTASILLFAPFAHEPLLSLSPTRYLPKRAARAGIRQ